MGKPLMIQIDDENRIDRLKEKMGAKTKIEVVRTALGLLENEVSRSERVKRWQKAARIVGKSGLDVLKEYQTSGRFTKLP